MKRIQQRKFYGMLTEAFEKRNYEVLKTVIQLPTGKKDIFVNKMCFLKIQF